MDNLPTTGLLRIHQIVGTKQNPGPIPISRSGWWAGVKSGKYPKPIKLGTRTTCWRAEDIQRLIAQGL